MNGKMEEELVSRVECSKRLATICERSTRDDQGINLSSRIGSYLSESLRELGILAKRSDNLSVNERGIFQATRHMEKVSPGAKMIKRITSSPNANDPVHRRGSCDMGRSCNWDSELTIVSFEGRVF